MKDSTKEFLTDLHELLQKHRVTIGVNLDGDTHGLMTEFVVEEGFNKDVVLNYSPYLDAEDLGRFLKNN